MKTILIILTLFLAGCYYPPRECCKCQKTVELTKRLHQHRLGHRHCVHKGKYKDEMSKAARGNPDYRTEEEKEFLRNWNEKMKKMKGK